MRPDNRYFDFLNYLNTTGVRYAVLHDWVSLGEGKLSDLDLVVSANDLRRLESSLHEHYRVLTVLQYEASGFGFVLAHKNRHSSSFLITDLTTDYRWKGRIFLTDEELLKERRQWRGMWVVGPRQEFAYLLLKKIYEKGFVPEHQRLRLKQLAGELGQEAYATALKLLGKKWGTKVIDWIIQEQWAELEASADLLRYYFRRTVVKYDPLNPLRYWLPEIRRMLSRFRHPTGLFVAVLGPDGAGKSTLIEHLKVNLAGVFRRTAVFHLRPGVMGPKGSNAPVANPHGKQKHPLWLSLLKISFYTLDCSLGYLLRVRQKLVRSTLVLFDRYYDDLLVDPRRYRYGGPKWFARLARRFIPKPDLFLILDVPPGMLLARKQEVSLQELIRQREAYRRLGLGLPNAIFLDGSLPLSEVAQNASEAILDYLHMRYHKSRHLWFGENSSETVKWLSSTLISSSEKACLTSSKLQRDSSGTQWHTDGSLGWLCFKDGRGYLIPLDSREAAVNSLRLYNPQNPKARLAKKALRLALKSGVAQVMLPRLHIHIHRETPQDKTKRVLLFEHLRSLLDERDLRFAVSTGKPGPQRKPVIQVLRRTGETICYVKVGWNKQTGHLVQNEKRALEALRRYPFQYGVLPRPIYFGYWNGRCLLVTEPMSLNGKLGTQMGMLDDLHIRFLTEVFRAEILKEKFEDSTFFASLTERIRAIRRTTPPHQVRMLEDVVDLLASRVGPVEIPWIWRLGDFTPWNIGLDREKGRVQVIDLEYASNKNLPGWDVFHFLSQSFNGRSDPLKDLYSSPYPIVSRYFDLVKIDPRLIPVLCLCYLIDLWTVRAHMWQMDSRPKSARALEVFSSTMKSIARLAERIRREEKNV
jgi:thymidylate kinase